MKKLLFSFTVLAVALSSCNKENASMQIPEEPTTQAEKTVVNFSLSTVASKAGATEVGTLKENQINRVDAFVFNADGTLDGYAKVDVADQQAISVKVSATTGSGKHFVAVVNAAGAGDGSLTDDFMEKVDKITDLASIERVFSLRNNKLEGFQMYGYTTKELVAGDNTVPVKLHRAVSRVKIDKITRNFSIPSLQSQEMKVTKIYVTNVVGSVANTVAYNNYFGTFKTALNDTWFNKYNNDKAKGFVTFTEDVNVKTLTYSEIPSENQILANSKSLVKDIRFYVMPNDINPHTGKLTDEERLEAEQALQGLAVWAPCLTKLVIETQLAGKTYYYSIPIVKRAAYPSGEITDGIGFNETFNFSEIVLTRPGSENPDIPTLVSSVDFKLEVEPWNVHVMETGNGSFEI